MKNITISEKKALEKKNQNNILGVSETNFFQINNFLNEHIKSLDTSLTKKFNNFNLSLNNKLINDQFSISGKIYLEDLMNQLIVEILLY